MSSDGLERFVEAQEPVYAAALEELRQGRKRGHWMWFIFPQLRGLGSSAASRLYGIDSRAEAEAYLRHPLLGPRLLECVETVNSIPERSAERIFGPVDAKKLRSSMTLFDLAGGGPAFARCLAVFFGGARDPRTVELLDARVARSDRPPAVLLNRVGITGASGCGVTTLGAALAARLDAVHIDMDDHYWIATDPPYRQKREVPERLVRIRAEQARTGRWVVSGTLDDWAESVTRDCELIVFLEVPTELRLERLRRRERARFGDSLLPGGAMHETHREFIEWAAQYERGILPGRNKARHEKWLAGVAKPVLRLDGSRPTPDLVSEILGGG
jgi:uncharacterized protein (DUF1810 family)/adenylate kinase family enzyme